MSLREDPERCARSSSRWRTVTSHPLSKVHAHLRHRFGERLPERSGHDAGHHVRICAKSITRPSAPSRWSTHARFSAMAESRRFIARWSVGGIDPSAVGGGATRKKVSSVGLPVLRRAHSKSSAVVTPGTLHGRARAARRADRSWRAIGRAPPEQAPVPRARETVQKRLDVPSHSTRGCGVDTGNVRQHFIDRDASAPECAIFARAEIHAVESNLVGVPGIRVVLVHPSYERHILLVLAKSPREIVVNDLSCHSVAAEHVLLYSLRLGDS